MRKPLRQASLVTLVAFSGLLSNPLQADQLADRLNRELNFITSDQQNIVRNVDLITTKILTDTENMVSDSISTGQAGLKKPQAKDSKASTDGELEDFNLDSLEPSKASESTKPGEFKPARKRAR
ncbi:MAG: hypothetical protein GY909_16565 [Oligoflexia bacterium]|nr:hypothetical protein [Oligoflexia bacterium]